jgi:hypothetical protein
VAEDGLFRSQADADEFGRLVHISWLLFIVFVVLFHLLALLSNISDAERRNRTRRYGIRRLQVAKHSRLASWACLLPKVRQLVPLP